MPVGKAGSQGFLSKVLSIISGTFGHSADSSNQNLNRLTHSPHSFSFAGFLETLNSEISP